MRHCNGGRTRTYRFPGQAGRKKRVGKSPNPFLWHRFHATTDAVAGGVMKKPAPGPGRTPPGIAKGLRPFARRRRSSAPLLAQPERGLA